MLSSRRLRADNDDDDDRVIDEVLLMYYVSKYIGLRIFFKCF